LQIFESDSYVYNSELADAIMSLSLPTLSEEEIEILWRDTFTAAYELGQTKAAAAQEQRTNQTRRWLSRGFRKGAKWAM
jgi:hypothetical protein